MKRRKFLLTSSGAALGLMLKASPHSASDANIEIHLDRAGATINPHIFGHFIEHLGGVIYDGIWVGKDSSIPNLGGIRKQFVDDMKRIGTPNLRWPGGCFADGYHWRDGVGSTRPLTYNYWQYRLPAGQYTTESNAFGTHEFLQLCRLIGAEPYLAGNVGSGTVREFHEWVEYCNAPADLTSLARERASNGDKEPYNVRYWGVGNESWGCGGNMKPQEYAIEYRKYVTQFPTYTSPYWIATGPRGHSKDMDIGWTTGFFEAMQGMKTPVHGFSLHFYSDFRNTKMKVGQFTESEWYTVLWEALRTEKIIEAHWSEMGKYDKDHFTKFVIDEWGVWYPDGEELKPEYILSQPLTLRDALHTAVTFDVFNRHAEKIDMANVAQTINCLHSLFLAHEEKFIRTPVYYVFQMYKGHQGGRMIAMTITADDLTIDNQHGSVQFKAISGSASLKEKKLTVTLTNLSLDENIKTKISVRGASVIDARGEVLTHNDWQATNSFENENEVMPENLRVNVSKQATEILMPKKSVVSVELLLR